MKALIVRSSFMLLVLLCSVVPAQQATESPAMQKEIENLLGRVHEVVSLYEIDGKEELRCHLVVLNQKEPNVLELQDVSSVPGFTPVGSSRHKGGASFWATFEDRKQVGVFNAFSVPAPFKSRDITL
jgi:hypothetical protein